MNKKVILTVLVVLLVVVGIWYFAMPKNNNGAAGTTSTPGSTSTVVVVNSTDTAVTGPGANASRLGWKTYSNTASGFAFEYPPTLTGKLTAKSLPFDQLSVVVAGVQPVDTTNTSALPQLSVTVTPKQASDTIQTDIMKISNDPSQCAGTLAVSTTTVVGQQAALLICTPHAQLNLAPYAILDFYHNALGFKIVVTNIPPAQDVVQEIGDTFTFTK